MEKVHLSDVTNGLSSTLKCYGDFTITFKVLNYSPKV